MGTWDMEIIERELRINEMLSQMYFERWGLLVPPSGKARSEGYVSLLSHVGTIPQRCNACNVGVRACGRARNRNGHSAKVVPFVPKLLQRCPRKEYSSWVYLQ
jgi:hypothetical protein